MVQLSEIHLKNFKSFKNAKLKIPPGFTAIMGPNGSGKSNTIDGICFVLGKTSAKSLRAGRFNELITYHKNKRAEYAEVILLFDNKDRKIPIDSDKVGVSRKVKLKGDNNYYLIWYEEEGEKTDGKGSDRDNNLKDDDNKDNKDNDNNKDNKDKDNNKDNKNNKNKDIKPKLIEKRKKIKKSQVIDIFNKLSLSGDGLNIILQGDLIRLIEMSPRERRKVIDEISGISEYDEKKEKAQKELERAREYIEKIDIRVNEVKASLKKLKKEKEDAEKYRILTEELKTVKYVLTTKKIEVLKAVLDNLNNNIMELNKSKGEYKNKINYIEENISNLKEKLENIVEELKEKGNEEVMELHKTIKELELTIENHRKNLENSLKELKYSNEQLENKKKELNETREKIETLRKKTMEREEEIKSINENIKHLEEEKKSLRSTMEKWETHINILKNQEGKLTERFSEYQRELHKLRTELNKVVGDIDKKSFQVAQNKEIIKKLEEELKLLDREGVDSKSIYRELEDVSVELEFLKKKLKKLEEERKVLQRKREELYGEYAKENGKIKALKSLENYNLNNTIKSILDANLPGVIDIVGNLGKTKEKYKLAIEVAGGNRLNHIVVRRMEDGVRAIEYLKRNKLGRATFLPMDRIRGREPENIIDEGIIGRAIDLVEFKEEYRNILNYVFGNTFIVKDLKTAKELSKRYRGRFVSLEGDVIEPSGAMVGGSVRSSANIRVEIDTSKLEKLAEELKNIEERLNGKDGGINNKIEEINEKINIYHSKKIELENKLKFIKENEKRKVEVLKNNKIKIKELQLINKKINDELGDLEILKDELDHKIKDIEEKIEDTLHKKERVLQELKSYEDSSIIKRIKELEEKIENLKKRRNTLENDTKRNVTLIKEVLIPKMSEINEKIRELNEKINMLQKNIEFYKNSIEKNIKVLGEKRERYLKLSENLEELTNKKMEYEEEIKKLYDDKKRIMEKIEDMTNEINKLSIDKAKYETKLEDEEKKLYLCEGIEDISEEILNKISNMEINELEKHSIKLENTIKELEPVNMRAIEDYAYIEERYGELFNKRKEYEKDEMKYIQLIEEVEKRKKEVFMEVFEKVSKNYQEIYKSIGGTGKLSLENPENPFEGGLLIDASPQNKSLQSLDVMSGGEKSLTALAFLFAIQNLMPAPFYVLDEVDAALDAKNASLIGDMIKNASKESQFIVISHREQMINKADTLYGVYMENGLSKIVGIKL